MKHQTQTQQERLARRMIHRPPALIYLLLAKIWKVMYQKRLNINYHYEIDVKSLKGPFLVISNHASRLDYIYTGIAFLPHRLNYVAGYNEFFRSHLAFIFRLLQIIPKRNFTPDIYTIREVSRIIRNKGNVIIFPEGMSSISGSNQPCAIGGGKLIKHFKIPVYMTKISGGYLTNTKYCLDERPGRVDVTVSQMLSPEQIETMNEEQIQLLLDQVIAHDDYAWNKTARVKFDGKGEMAKNLHTLLYWCPRCGTELSMIGEGNTITCKHCGNGATMNEYYDLIPFHESCVIPETPKVWFDEQRKLIYQLIQKESFELKEMVKLGILPNDQFLKDLKTSEIVGEGELILNKEGLTYQGTKNGRFFTLHMEPKDLPTYGMCTDVTFFSIYYQDEYYEFIPSTECVAKWLLATEEIHRLAGGKWKNFPWANTYEEEEKVVVK